MAHGPPGLGLDSKAQPGGKADGPQQAYAIFVKARRRLANGPNDPVVQVGLPAHIIDDRVRQRVKKHAVDGEITPQRVLPGRAEADRYGVTTVVIGSIRPKRRHLIGHALQDDEDHPELRPDRDRLWKYLLDLGGPGIRGDIEVFGLNAQQAVPHTAAGKIGCMAVPVQCLHNRPGLFFPLAHTRMVTRPAREGNGAR